MVGDARHDRRTSLYWANLICPAIVKSGPTESGMICVQAAEACAAHESMMLKFHVRRKPLDVLFVHGTQKTISVLALISASDQSDGYRTNEFRCWKTAC